MKQFIVCQLLAVLFGMTLPLASAQQNQSLQQLTQEIELLKSKVSELEKQLQIVENVEKMELQAQLAEAKAKHADANAKLINTEFGKFKRELRIDNEERMRSWSYWLFGILSFIAVASGTAVWFSLKSLIADRVEKSLDGFKKGLKELDILKNQLGVLEKEHTVSILQDLRGWFLQDEHGHPEPVKALREETLLEILTDGRYDDANLDLQLRYKAVEILAARKSSRLVSPTLEILNSVVDSDSHIDFQTENSLCGFINSLARIHTPESYQGLKRFLNRLLTESPKHKDSFLMATVLAFGRAAIELNMRDSVSILKSAMPHLQDPGYEDLSKLVEYFDRFNDSAGIKEILTKHVTSGMPEVKRQCLDALEKYDPEFAANWRAQHTTDDAES